MLKTGKSNTDMDRTDFFRWAVAGDNNHVARDNSNQLLLIGRAAEFIDQADPAKFCIVGALKFDIQAGVVCDFP